MLSSFFCLEIVLFVLRLLHFSLSLTHSLSLSLIHKRNSLHLLAQEFAQYDVKIKKSPAVERLDSLVKSRDISSVVRLRSSEV